jgi:hypothetical protein
VPITSERLKHTGGISVIKWFLEQFVIPMHNGVGRKNPARISRHRCGFFAGKSPDIGERFFCCGSFLWNIGWDHIRNEKSGQVKKLASSRRAAGENQS